MKPDAPHILLVNPWIHDFAAYDFWAKPLGLLSLAAMLRSSGFITTYIDCLDRFHPKAPFSDPLARCGRGPYLKTRLPKPPGLEDVPKNFSRYGIKKKWLEDDLNAIDPPDLILTTSLMTYWYPGVFETIACLKTKFPDTPLILGGVFATLCHDFAVAHSGADMVFSGPAEKEIVHLVCKQTGFDAEPAFDVDDPDAWPRPAFDLQRKMGYIPLLTSRGCPFSCAYCASGFLNPDHWVRDPDAVADDICFWEKKWGIKDFVFYDDALLARHDRTAEPLLEKIIKKNLNLRFHTPNAIHVREISEKMAALLFKSGFKSIRLGLETADFKQREMDRKVTENEFLSAVSSLKKAGFKKNRVGAYLLAGLPNMSMEAFVWSAEMVKKAGLKPVPAYYSPIPHTQMWEEAVAVSRYDIQSDPLFTNNAIFPCAPRDLSWDDINRMKTVSRGSPIA